MSDECLNRHLQPTRGHEFVHARVMDAERRPMRYRVTRVARGVVYYRPVDGGGCECSPIEDFWKVVSHGHIATQSGEST